VVKIKVNWENETGQERVQEAGDQDCRRLGKAKVGWAGKPRVLKESPAKKDTGGRGREEGRGRASGRV